MGSGQHKSASVVSSYSVKARQMPPNPNNKLPPEVLDGFGRVLKSQSERVRVSNRKKPENLPPAAAPQLSKENVTNNSNTNPPARPPPIPLPIDETSNEKIETVSEQVFQIDKNQIEEPEEFKEKPGGYADERKSPEAPEIDVEEEVETKIDPNVLKEQREAKEREAYLDAEKIANDLRKAEEEEILKQKTVMGSMEGQAKNILDKYR
ncbi:unnamed protein product [Blepharisma stoltei]|uniref:Uncharacterized protein n=1 Tax=Blepharisma stoltei TaxID=1481888 RepID=A0AAU9K366_9CILI|nr:unnamed protein product [Blepharisma stoltei]